MTTTIETLTVQQINSLRCEALAAGDYTMIAICDLALDGECDLADVDGRDRARVRCMSQRDAYAEIAKQISDAEEAYGFTMPVRR